MCVDCSNITLPQGNTGNTGPTGATGAAGTNGTNGLDGASLLDSLYDRSNTNNTSLSEIAAIPVDITKVFSSVDDGLEFEAYVAYKYNSGIDGGSCSVYFEDGVNSINLFPGGIPSLTDGRQVLTMKGAINRVSNSAINYKIEIFNPSISNHNVNITYITPILDKGNCYIVTNPGTINNTSSNLQLAVKGLVTDGNNTITVEYFTVKAIKKLV